MAIEIMSSLKLVVKYNVTCSRCIRTEGGELVIDVAETIVNDESVEVALTEQRKWRKKGGIGLICPKCVEYIKVSEYDTIV